MARLEPHNFDVIPPFYDCGIAIFAYNRPKHFHDCLTALANNEIFENFKCHIYLDGPKNDQDLRAQEQIKNMVNDFQKSFTNLTLHLSETNHGLRKSLIEGISEVLNEFSSIVVVEDDLVVSPDFLNFMLLQLNQYRDKSEVGSITGYKENIFPPFYKGDTVLSARHSCWGWATWRDRWQQVSWSPVGVGTPEFRKIYSLLMRIGSDLGEIYEAQQLGLVNSWAIDFDATAARFGWRSIHPRIALVQNNGRDGSGTHFVFSSNGNKDFKTLKKANNKHGLAKSSDIYELTLRLRFSKIARQIGRIYSGIRQALTRRIIE